MGVEALVQKKCFHLAAAFGLKTPGKLKKGSLGAESSLFLLGEGQGLLALPLYLSLRVPGLHQSYLYRHFDGREVRENLSHSQ